MKIRSGYRPALFAAAVGDRFKLDQPGEEWHDCTIEITGDDAMFDSWALKIVDGPPKWSTSGWPYTMPKSELDPLKGWSRVQQSAPGFIPMTMEVSPTPPPTPPTPVAAVSSDPCWRCYTGDTELKHSCGSDVTTKFDPDIKPGRRHNVRIAGL